MTYNIQNLKLDITKESVNIYLDNGDNEEPTHICYWHLDEVEEDATVMISIARAIDLFYRNPTELLQRLYGESFTKVLKIPAHKMK